MLKKNYLKSFAKFEQKKRTSMGDEAFLKKYTASFASFDKMLKLILVPVLMLSLFALIVYIIMLGLNFFDGFFLAMSLIWLCQSVFWTFLTIAYYSHRFEIHRQKITEWTHELTVLEVKQELIEEGVSGLSKEATAS